MMIETIRAEFAADRTLGGNAVRARLPGQNDGPYHDRHRLKEIVGKPADDGQDEGNNRKRPNVVIPVGVHRSVTVLPIHQLTGYGLAVAVLLLAIGRLSALRLLTVGRLGARRRRGVRVGGIAHGMLHIKLLTVPTYRNAGHRPQNSGARKDTGHRCRARIVQIFGSARIAMITIKTMNRITATTTAMWTKVTILAVERAPCTSVVTSAGAPRD